jgi:hypothetical protein
MARSIILSLGWYLDNIVLLLYKNFGTPRPNGSGNTWGKAFPISGILAG